MKDVIELLVMLDIATTPRLNKKSPIGFNCVDNPGKAKALDNAIKTIVGNDDDIANHILTLAMNNLDISQLMAVKNDIERNVIRILKERCNG